MKLLPLGIHNFTVVVHVPNAPDSNTVTFQFAVN